MISNLLLIFPKGYEDVIKAIIAKDRVVIRSNEWDDHGWSINADEVTRTRLADALTYLDEQDLPYQYRAETVDGTLAKVITFTDAGEKVGRSWDEADEVIEVEYLNRIKADVDKLLSAINKRVELTAPIDLTNQMEYRSIYKTKQLLQV